MVSSFMVGAVITCGILLVAIAVIYRPAQLHNRVLAHVATRRQPRSIPKLRRVFNNVLETIGSTTSSVERRTNLLGTITPGDFRIRQLQWAGLGFVCGALAGFSLVTRGLPTIAAIGAVVLCAAAGVLGADWYLSKQCEQRKKAYTAQLPDVVEMLALAVAAGEPIRVAIERVTHVGDGEMVTELRRTMADVHAGASLVRALTDMGERCDNRNVARFTEAVVAALEQGSGLASSLHAQARDARDAARRDLLEAGGKAEIAMMMPVVFIIMPITVVFTVFPALQALRLT
ncbi:type II secretion system F family protein [Trueperella bialowiezensis]|uniref:Flp pilus assembly protein TadB n=1 Tax=Trueperella bialowiezensis TaxID=312285 RepID=A0A448PGB6_9ACTO|nr:type II secretion system F family protein [Trueperella bialowiezensis]VEI13956.1 Flp pilus assembly protein TadB [Trueperella bialowiezensis]